MYTFLVLLMLVQLMGLPIEQTEEYDRKRAILDELAERFKAETGFVGEISYNLQSMNFSTITGNFKDIVVTAPQDTVFMRQVFDQVVSKVMPYISAREGQLQSKHISNNMFGIRTSYEQVEHSYSVFGAGILKVVYSYQTGKLTINDSTVHLPHEFVAPTLTIDDAINIYSDIVPYDELKTLFSDRKPTFGLYYSNINEYKINVRAEYHLCWVGGSARKLVIDSSSGEIYVNESAAK